MKEKGGVVDEARGVRTGHGEEKKKTRLMVKMKDDEEEGGK